MIPVKEPSTLLVCTVGGSPEPVVAALKHWRPVRVRFVHTPQTKGDVEGKVVPKARDEGMEFDAGRYDLFELPDGQDLASCLDSLRQLTPMISEWAKRTACQVVVDFTGGTKCMSAAIGIQASRWPCVFSYVSGGERTKDGVGVVVSGTEKVVHQANPWDALGHQAVEEFVVLFNQHAFLAAANVAAVTMRRVSRPDRKRELASLKNLASALDAFDRFDHTTSRNLLESVAKSANDLRAVLGSVRGDRVLAGAAQLADHLGRLGNAPPPSRHHVLDLLANAERRANEGRYDDAVARLYRTIEAIAQVALKERHAIESTESIPLDRLPPNVRVGWASKATDDMLTLGLQEAYALLSDLDDPLGRKFKDAGLSGSESPLIARNRSILAHGFDRVSQKSCEKLQSVARTLVDAAEVEIPAFPRISTPEDGE